MNPCVRYFAGRLAEGLGGPFGDGGAGYLSQGGADGVGGGYEAVPWRPVHVPAAAW